MTASVAYLTLATVGFAFGVPSFFLATRPFTRERGDGSALLYGLAAALGITGGTLFCILADAAS